jgi:hypothetical protein
VRASEELQREEVVDDRRIELLTSALRTPMARAESFEIMRTFASAGNAAGM